MLTASIATSRHTHRVRHAGERFVLLACLPDPFSRAEVQKPRKRAKECPHCEAAEAREAPASRPGTWTAMAMEVAW